MNWYDRIELSAILLLTALIAIACISGCATSLTPMERELQQAIDAENWTLCKLSYSGLNRRTRTSHTHRKFFQHSPYQITDDLRDNNCRMVLGEYWITR